MNFAVYCFGSLALTAVVLAKTLAVYPSYYSAMVSLATNTPSLYVVTNQTILLLYLLGRLVIWLFFGQLRTTEVEQIYHKAWFLSIDCILLAGNLDLASPAFEFAVMVLGIGFLLVLHWILEERVMFLYQMMTLPSPVAQLRIFMLTSLMCYVDMQLCTYAWNQLMRKQTMVILFTSYYVDLVTTSIRCLLRLSIDFYEIYVHGRNVDDEDDDMDQEDWELKESLIFTMDLVLDLFALFVYLVVCYLLRTYSFHMLFSVADKARKIYVSVGDFWRARTAKSELSTVVQPATQEDLDRSDVCVICREEMSLSATSERLTPQKMRCGHVIHHACLKSWLNHSQNCPTCRQSVKGGQNAFATSSSAASAATPVDNATPDTPGTETRSPSPDVTNWSEFTTRVSENGVTEVQFGSTWVEYEVL